MDAEQNAFDELCCYTLSRGDAAFIHQHVVDAFAVQKADEQTKPIKITFGLVGLYLHIEKQFSGRRVQRAHMSLAKQKRTWPLFGLPNDRGAITVAEVLADPRDPGATRRSMPGAARFGTRFAKATQSSPICSGKTGSSEGIRAGRAMIGTIMFVLRSVGFAEPVGPRGLASSWRYASCDSALRSSGLRRLNREAHSACIQHRGQAVQGWISGLGEHSIEALPIQVGIARQCPDAAVGVCDIAQREKEHMGVFILQASVEILSRLVRILERFQETLPIRYGFSGWSWHRNTPSKIALLSGCPGFAFLWFRRKAGSPPKSPRVRNRPYSRDRNRSGVPRCRRQRACSRR